MHASDMNNMHMHMPAIQTMYTYKCQPCEQHAHAFASNAMQDMSYGHVFYVKLARTNDGWSEVSSVLERMLLKFGVSAVQVFADEGAPDGRSNAKAAYLSR